MRKLCRCGLLIKVERIYKMNIIWCVFSICVFLSIHFFFFHSSSSFLFFVLLFLLLDKNPAVLNLNLLAKAAHHHHLSSKVLTLTFPFFSKYCQKKGGRKELSVLPSDSVLYSCTRASKDSPLLFLGQDHALKSQFTRTGKECWKCLYCSQIFPFVTQHGASNLPRAMIHTLHWP